MKGAILAAVAALSTSVNALGQAVVKNYCSDELWLRYTPAGASPQPQAYKLNESWSETWTSLASGGWSIKIGGTSDIVNNIMQYEYTYIPDATPSNLQLWWDMSLVDDNDGNNTVKTPLVPYTFTSDSSDCVPNEAYFACPTCAGMQLPCVADVTLTLTLCGDNANNGTDDSGTSSSASGVATSSAAAYSSAISQTVATTNSASATTFATSASSAAGGYFTGVAKLANVQSQQTTSAVTSASTSLTTSVAQNGNVVTETAVDMVTEVATVFVTARDAEPTAAVHRRHVHGHPHGHRA